MSSAKRKATTRPPTDRQKDFLAAVVALTDTLERPPNAKEIGDYLGITRLGARRQLQNMADKGLLRDVPKVISSGQWALTRAGELEHEED